MNNEYYDDSLKSGYCIGGILANSKKKRKSWTAQTKYLNTLNCYTRKNFKKSKNTSNFLKFNSFKKKDI